MSEEYTPGYTRNSVDFMARRSMKSHGEFLLDYAAAAARILDCGCGPASISLSLAADYPSTQVVGVDLEESQAARARGEANRQKISNVEFRTASVYQLPFADGDFDFVFSHALFEHLNEPLDALREIRRVVAVNGVVAVCSPDWQGFLLAPPSKSLEEAISCYEEIQTRNGGDVHVGRKLGSMFATEGFVDISMHARYEVYDSTEHIGEYLAVQLDNQDESGHASTVRSWAAEPHAMFAQAWVSCVGKRT